MNYYYDSKKPDRVTYSRGFWHSGNTVLSISPDGGVAKLDVQKDTAVQILPYMGPPDGRIERIYTCSDCKDLYILIHNMGGLWKVALGTGIATKLKASCYLHERNNMSLISDELALITKTLRYPREPKWHELDCYTTIYLWNIKTGQEEMLVLP